MRGDKLGIVGKNGAGKTTLLKVLLGELAPSRGKVRLGTNLQVAYFDQLRDTLDPEQTVAENVGEGNDRLSIAGQTKHIVGYLQEFLFNPDRARTLVKFLSGGEKNRALLAKMMTRPANVIVLDEPTNDLDSETLELLEEQLLQFQGTLLMVSHDRTFLNNVVSSLIVFEEYGLREYDGGYDDWQRAVARSQESKTVANGNAKPVVNMQTRVATPEPTKARKLSFKEQFELDGLPDRIERLDQQIAETHQILAAPDFYKRPSTEIATLTKQLTQLEEELRQAYERLELLESLA
jgi:ATP-binding cassette subfamily F protein uup